MKIDKISILLTTKNCLPYLKAALKSVSDNHSIVSEVVVWNDGSTDGTNEFLKQREAANRYTFKLKVMNNEKEGAGLCTATNTAMAACENEFVFLMHDDMIAAPNFDTNLTKHVKSEYSIISNKCIEPGLIPVSKQFIKYNCGGTIDEFDEKKFLKHVKLNQNLADDVVIDEIGYPLLISKTLFNEVGGLDERFNTGPLNDPDLFYRLFILKLTMPEMVFMRSQDSILYHFSGKATRFRGDDKKKDKSWGLVEQENFFRFIRKWGESPKYLFGSSVMTQLRKPIDGKELGLVILLKDNLGDVIKNNFLMISNFFDEIVILDDMSKNFEEVKQYFASYPNVIVKQRALDKDFATQRNYATDLISTEWVFHLDADETFEGQLIEALRQIVRSIPPEIKVVGMPRVNLLDNVRTEVYPDIQFRLHRKTAVWKGKVHERPDFQENEVGVIQAHIIHSKTKEQFNKQQDFYDNIKPGAGSGRVKEQKLNDMVLG